MVASVIEADCRRVKAGALPTRAKLAFATPAGSSAITSGSPAEFPLSTFPPFPAQRVISLAVSVGTVAPLKLRSPTPPAPPRSNIEAPLPTVKLASIESPASLLFARLPMAPAVMLRLNGLAAAAALISEARLLSTAKSSKTSRSRVDATFRVLPVKRMSCFAARVSSSLRTKAIPVRSIF